MTTYEELKASVAEELHLPSSHWTVTRMANLQAMLAVASQQFVSTQTPVAAKEVRELMDAITALKQEAGAVEPLQFNVNVVKSAKGIGRVTCEACGHSQVHTFDPDALAPLPPKPAPAPKPAPEAAKAKPAVKELSHYERALAEMDAAAPADSVSPMSVGGCVVPLRRDGTAGLAFNDPNPTRRC